MWKVIKKQINGGNLTVPGNDEIGACIGRRLSVKANLRGRPGDG